MNTAKSYIFLAAVAGIIVTLDELTKYIVRTQLVLGESWAPIPGLENIIRIVHWNNTGAAFGLLPQGSLVFTFIAIAVAIAIIYYWPRVPADNIALRFALALQFGGALGNLVDRLLNQGIVTDFVAVGRFPVFNIADASISVGVAILIISTWWDERKKAKQADSEPMEEGEHEEPSPGVDPAG